MPHARTAPEQPRRSTPARYAAVAAFVAAWMAAGWLLRLGANAYLLLGIPLTLAFHKRVRRLPLRALWVVDAPPLHLGRRRAFPCAAPIRGIRNALVLAA